MTHAEDQERAEFLQMHADFEREFGPMPQDCKWSGRGFYQTSHHAWQAQEYANKFDGFKAAWQAARRAPAVPVPQGWLPVPIEPTQEMQDAMHTTGHAPTRYAVMLAAAPQPQEAAKSNSPEFGGITPDSFETEGGFMCENSTSKPSAQASVSNVTLAAPVRMPAPDAYKHTLDTTEGIPGNQPIVKRTERSDNPFGVSGIDYDKSFPYSIEKLYTEQQVLDLLSAHGIEVSP